jgi:hypothetical protein
VIVAGRGLAAAMQHNDERKRALRTFRHEGKHAQGPRIRTEFKSLVERADPHDKRSLGKMLGLPKSLRLENRRKYPTSTHYTWVLTRN